MNKYTFPVIPKKLGIFSIVQYAQKNFLFLCSFTIDKCLILPPSAGISPGSHFTNFVKRFLLCNLHKFLSRNSPFCTIGNFFLGRSNKLSTESLCKLYIAIAFWVCYNVYIRWGQRDSLTAIGLIPFDSETLKVKT